MRDDVYRRLRDAIVDGTFAPGEQLRDAELAGWLGVSRTPIREALQRLAQAGLVVAEPGRSTSVTSLDLRATRDAQAVVAAMHQLAVREAVGQLTGADFARMRAANKRFAAALRAGDVDAALAADDELHAIPVAAAGNQAVQAGPRPVHPAAAPGGAPPVLLAHRARVGCVARQPDPPVRGGPGGAGRCRVLGDLADPRAIADHGGEPCPSLTFRATR